MGAGIIRVEKVKREGLHGLQVHNDRIGRNYGNPDIDLDRSPDNIHLIDNGDYASFVKECIRSEVARKVRSDAVVMVDGIVAMPEEDYKRMGHAEALRYLEDACEFLAGFFGHEHMVHYTIHLDETVPHAHWGAVPIKDGCLSWKRYFDGRNGLGAFQDSFYEQVSSRYGLDRGERRKRGEPAKRHKSMAQMKREARAEVDSARAKAAREVEKAEKARQDAARAERQRKDAECAARSAERSLEEFQARIAEESARLESVRREREAAEGRVGWLERKVAEARAAIAEAREYIRGLAERGVSGPGRPSFGLGHAQAVQESLRASREQSRPQGPNQWPTGTRRR